MDRKALIIEHINERLSELEELGKIYSKEKIEELASNLEKTDKSLNEINTLIDNKFSNQVRKINHNNYLASLKEYYLSSIDKLKKGNNCYLLSYDQGVKVIEQAYIKEEKKINPSLTRVSINGNKKGYQKDNSINNDYELIMSDIAYLLNIPYANTYRIFNSKMEPTGIVNISFDKPNERFLNLEETLQFVKEESSKFTLKNELIDYHDKNIKYGIKELHDNEDIKKNLEYVFKLFQALPDIKKDNIEELKKDYLNMKVFELLTNSIDNNLSNIGLIVNKEKLEYTYRLSPSYNKYTISLPNIEDYQTICNFHIVDKKQLLGIIVNNYYKEVKDLLSLIVMNKETLISIIDQVIKEHLSFDEYNKYIDLVSDNFKMITDIVEVKKEREPDTKEDIARYKDNNILYENRIAPFLTNYVGDYDTDRGSTILTAIVTLILFITVGIILLAIFAVSRMDM